MQLKEKLKMKGNFEMKKVLSVLLALSLCLSVAFLSGCGEKDNDLYKQYDLSEYVSLPDYNDYSVDEISVNITDSKIDAEIEERLANASTTKEVTEGTVNEGDKVTISFKGTLADGTTEDGMQSDSYELTLGSGGMIDGFEEGIYGMKVGETKTLNLQFPDPYENNEELSGQDVAFEITVINKKVEEPAVLNEEFVKANSEAETVEEYKALVKKDLEEEEYDEQESNAKVNVFSDIVEAAEVSSVPDELKQYEADLCRTTYETYCTSYGMEWDEFLEAMQFTQEEFDEQLDVYAEEMAKTKMIVYALAANEDVYYKDSEVIDKMLEMAGVDSEETFESTYGTTAETYAATYNSYGMKVSMMLDDVLTKIYDRLADK